MAGRELLDGPVPGNGVMRTIDTGNTGNTNIPDGIHITDTSVHTGNSNSRRTGDAGEYGRYNPEEGRWNRGE